MTLDDLCLLVASGEFHHATYRDMGSIWEGLYIYARDPNGFNGFALTACFPKGEQAEQAHAIVRHTGISVGAYGQG
jgi:hypothetical protein